MNATLAPRRGFLSLSAHALSLMVAFALTAAACGDAGSTSAAVDTVADVPDTSGGVDTGTADADTGGVGGVDVPSTCAMGTLCDDSDPCTTDDACDAAGACVGTAKTCDDGLACTADACQADGSCANTLVAGFCLSEGDTPACVSNNGVDPDNSCRLCSTTGGAGATWITLAQGAPCNDGDACTTGETCELGACKPAGMLTCASQNPCVDTTCDPQQGCVSQNNSGACDDGDPCSLNDVCDGGSCVAGADAPDCGDSDDCTLDSCVPGTGCVNDPDAKCDDDDACTNDSCTDGDCANVAFTGPCEDGDACTTGEVCDAAGTCAGGTVSDCEDFNDCTLDSCHPVQGCLHLFLEGGCDDGSDCTSDDLCVAGACFGAKSLQLCDFCPITPSDHANKIVNLEIMGDGNMGSGLDVDGDPATCAPSNNCSGGVDNALAPLAILMNDSIDGSVQVGAVKWVVDLSDLTFDGELFDLIVYDTGLDATNPMCDFQVETCAYRVAQLSLDQDCEPYFAVHTAQVIGDQIVAGTSDDVISMILPLESGALLALTIAKPQIRATYTTDGNGKVTSMNAIIGGAIPKTQLVAAINGLDPSDLPIDKEQALQLLDLLIEEDIDLDGDGINEASSVGMRINTIPATITQ